MRAIWVLLALLLLLSPSQASALDELLNSGRITTIQLLLERAIASNLIAGGVVAIGNHNGILATAARGGVAPRAGSAPMDERTIFDLASLTKVIATTPAVMRLLDDGRISLLDPLSRWFPEFRGSPGGDITILNLLTHTSGLGDFDLRGSQNISAAVAKAAAEKRRPRPGSSFDYADINFILLGELVHRASGRTLDAFCRQELFEPLGAIQTMFLPPRDLADSIAPTLGFTSGVVQDRNARRLGSVAGHAGLFSSAADLARFARMILGGGSIDGKRVLSERVVNQMTVPYCFCNGRIVRGLGWDMESPFSAPKGSLFSEVSFGHTGYSGTSIWIDPKQDLFVVLLTRRLNYRDTRMFNQLRRDVSTIAAAAFGPGDSQDMAAIYEVARINAELMRPPSQAMANSPQRKLLAAAPQTAQKSSSHRFAEKKKKGRSMRRRPSGRIRRA